MMNEFEDDSFCTSSAATTPVNKSELKLIGQSESTDSYLDSYEDANPMITTEANVYKPVNYHWFYTSYTANKLVWLALSNKDSTNLEDVYMKNIGEIKKLRQQLKKENGKTSAENNKKYMISIKGGRFEVNLISLEKNPVYWSEKKTSNVRRCLWFYKESIDQGFVPYEEEYSAFLEQEYESTIRKNTFHKRIDYQRESDVLKSETNNLPKQGSVSSEEAFVFHSTNIMLHFTQATMLDEFGNLNSDAQRPRIVKRGPLEVVDKIENDEVDEVDHLCFVVHGIGEVCDLKFRPLGECVDDFREIGSYITQSHLKTYIDSKQINGRIEFLPVSWHEDLHGAQTGIDERLKPLTLQSAPLLREYSNSTILDVLFYTSPIYCQTVINKVGNELNRLIQIFREQNPNFNGSISLIGHSLGSLICFDILSNQYDNKRPNTERNVDKNTLNVHTNIELSNNVDLSETIEEFLKRNDLLEHRDVFMKEKINMKNLLLITEADLIQMNIPIGSRRLILDEIKKIAFKKEKEEMDKKIELNLRTSPSNSDFKNGLAGTGQIIVKYPQLNFKVSKFFALGSPIPVFQAVRGIEKMDLDYKFPTCDGFYNIFHPFDPVAYRFEPLVCPTVLKPVLMPHHKGRKRMHIELREGLSKVGEDMLKVGGELFKNAWTTISDTQSALFNKIPKPMLADSKEEPSKINTEKVSERPQANQAQTSTKTTEQMDSEDTEEKEETIHESLCNFGKINNGKRIDYVLQESPIESFNEYLFALASHACYWESEDTLLLIVKQLYGKEDVVDANVELTLTETQRRQSSWLTQVAAQSIASNVSKTLSYFQNGIPQSLASVLPPSNSNK